MKKNLFVLMLSTFVLMNAQPSYAMMDFEENEIESSLPTSYAMMDFEENEIESSLPTPSLSQQPRTKKWTPQAPMKESQLGTWIKRASRSPEEYRIVGNTLWIYQ